MRAIVYRRYGTADVLELAEVTKPTPAADRLLVRVKASSVNSWDWDLIQGKPRITRLFSGLRTPRVAVLGGDVAGTVEAVGSEVTDFKPGDDVVADLTSSGWGGFSEYTTVPEAVAAPKLESLTFEEAASLPHAAVLALQGLRKAGLREGVRVLINGAGGGAGPIAVQLAKATGAEVTGVDKAFKHEMVRSVGADHVVDYEQRDFTRMAERYDVIVDLVGRRGVRAYRRALAKGGHAVLVGGSFRKLFQAVTLGPLSARFGGKRVSVLAHKPRRADLIELNEMVDSGKVAPVVDRIYPLADVPDAVRRIAAGESVGKLVISV